MSRAPLELHYGAMETTLKILSVGLADVVERSARLAVAVDARPRMGSSGILWQPGVVVTADHAIRREEDIPVLLPDGTRTAAKLAGRDPGIDLAVLRLESAGTTEFERAPQLRAGELVLAVGRHEPGVLATMGIVSTAGGVWKTWRGGELDSLLRLDIAAYPRSSGSVVVDSEGRVAGMLTSGLTRTAPVAIPSATIDRVIAELLKHGRIARGYLGVGLQPVPLPPPIARTLGRQQASALIVLSVEPDGPADQAGLVLGDVLVELGGRAVLDTDDVQVALQGSIGRELKALVIRGGERLELVVKAGERRA